MRFSRETAAAAVIRAGRVYPWNRKQHYDGALKECGLCLSFALFNHSFATLKVPSGKYAASLAPRAAAHRSFGFAPSPPPPSLVRNLIRLATHAPCASSSRLSWLHQIRARNLLRHLHSWQHLRYFLPLQAQ
eukprot:5206825-Pleurochrysis_carterae.AAC.1